jgi:hypothetical protein
MHCYSQVKVLPTEEYSITVHVLYNINGDGLPAAVVIHGYHICTLKWFWSIGTQVSFYALLEAMASGIAPSSPQVSEVAKSLNELRRLDVVGSIDISTW